MFSLFTFNVCVDTVGFRSNIVLSVINLFNLFLLLFPALFWMNRALTCLFVCFFAYSFSLSLWFFMNTDLTVSFI